jgi:deoxyribodipyrimidine photo-lyase
MSRIPESRLQLCNDAPVQHSGEFVLYWMIAHRRTRWNFGLERAIEHAAELGKPLVVLEALRCGYKWASDRLHLFALQGMSANAQRFAAAGVRYYPYVERGNGEGKGLLEALAERACVVVTDDFPSFFLPRMVRAAARKLAVRLEQVDSNGLLPLRGTTRVFTTAHSFRAFLQKELPPHLSDFPLADPLSGYKHKSHAVLPKAVEQRWPAASAELLAGKAQALAKLPIDHTVAPASLHGGSATGEALLRNFVEERLKQYAERNQPDVPAASGLSPYLHWGHVSAHEIFHEVARRESWTPQKLGKSLGGSREGWWQMSPEAESFLDELVTWRELGYNMSSKQEDYDRYDALPLWALKTLRAHQHHPRPHLYSLGQLEAGHTGDALWNAAQGQLVREGRMHNYMRMLWGKRVLEWTKTPQEAYAALEHLNNKYALDGRDPNSYSGILWVFGRYDRPWGPERPIYGKVRYMSSENTARKLKVKKYVATYSPAVPADGQLPPPR